MWIKLSYHLIFEKISQFQTISSGPRWFLSNTVGCFVPTWACSWETDLKRFPPRWPSFSEQQLSVVFAFRFHQVCIVILLELTFFLFPHCFNFHSFPGIATAHYRSSPQKSHVLHTEQNRPVWNSEHFLLLCLSHIWFSSDKIVI